MRHFSWTCIDKGNDFLTKRNHFKALGPSSRPAQVSVVFRSVQATTLTKNEIPCAWFQFKPLQKSQWKGFTTWPLLPMKSILPHTSYFFWKCREVTLQLCFFESAVSLKLGNYLSQDMMICTVVLPFLKFFPIEKVLSLLCFCICLS